MKSKLYHLSCKLHLAGIVFTLNNANWSTDPFFHHYLINFSGTFRLSAKLFHTFFQMKEDVKNSALPKRFRYFQFKNMFFKCFCLLLLFLSELETEKYLPPEIEAK